ncbi:MAG: flavodoxin family protein, partial [Dehalococcoidia bacterium]|nr:flavodoxin family protein [Dehalococcoidia bacterium]
AKEKVKIKLLGISAGHRKKMNTYYLVLLALKAAEKFGRKVADVCDLETEIVDLADKHIEPCRNSEWNHMPGGGLPYEGTDRPKAKGCPIKNDYMATELIPKMKEADGFILGSPTYTWSYSSRFRLFTERVSPILWGGYLTGKPAAGVTVGEMPFGGQETCLNHINTIITASEMVCVSWYAGVTGVSGPPNGPLPWDKDYSTRVGAKGDRFAQWLAIYNGRRVAEYALMLKMAKRELGPIWEREFIKIYHPPRGDESWGWRRLDPEDEKEMLEFSPRPKAKK